MPQEDIKTARFDHVSNQGDLVFACDQELFAVSVDNTLNHAILEAKQIIEEEHGTPIPHASNALPISAIQAAVRAGESTHQIAKEFAVNEAIVRRFANPIETEKKYAIEQFLSMAAPKRGSCSSNEEAINRALEATDITVNSIAWNATRRGNNPWKIRASFEALGQVVQADWTWNMKENTITCVNTVAQKLLEGSQTFLQTTEENDTPTSPEMAAVRVQPSYAETNMQHGANTNPVQTTTEISVPPEVPNIQSPSVKLHLEPSEGITNPEVTNSTDESQNARNNTSAVQPTQTQQPSDQQVVSEPHSAPTNTVNTSDGSNSVQVEAAGDNDANQNLIADATSPDDPSKKAKRRNSFTSWMYGNPRKNKQVNDNTGEQHSDEQQQQTEPTMDANNELASEPSGSLRAEHTPQNANAANNVVMPTNTLPQESEKAVNPEPVQQILPSEQEETVTMSKQEPETNHTHKKVGRSAVPSWDEILFGQ